MEAVGALPIDRSARPGRASVLQVSVFVISLALLLWSVVGLIANPSFATGAAATSKRVLGVDFNGWHAALGFVLFGPGLIAARRHQWAVLFTLAAVVSLVGSGAWALVDTRPAEILPFVHNNADAVLHFSSAAAYGIAFLADFGAEIEAPAGEVSSSPS